MPLLDAQLRGRLPPLYAQEAESEPMVYAKFYLPGSRLAWYVFEGQPEGSDFVFFGFASGHYSEFTRFRLSDLQAMRGLIGEEVERDLTFKEGRLTDVVPAPDS
jgi:hypothetical protein